MDELAGVTFTRSSERILTDPEIDVVLVASPTGDHFSMTMRALEAGKHVWCEKPMATSLRLAESALKRAEEMGLVLLESDMFLRHPLHQALRETLSRGDLGSVRAVAARFGFPHRDRGDFRYSAEAGGGALLDAGFYPVAALVDLLGRDLRLVGSTLEVQDGFEVDTGGSALVVGSEEAVGHADWGFGRSYRNEIEVWAERGSVSLGRAFSKPPSLATTIEITHEDGDHATIEVPAADQFAAMIDDFSQVTASPGSFDRSDLLARAELMEAIRTAA